ALLRIPLAAPTSRPRIPMPRTDCRGQLPAPTAAHYAWLSVGIFILTVYGSVIPLQFQPRPLDEAAAVFREMTYFQPSLLEARGDWVVSMVLFMTLGFLPTAALAVDHPWSVGLGAAVLVVPGCFVLSLAVEFLQVYFPPRTVSVNDVVVESLG